MLQLRILLLAASPPDKNKVFVDEFKDVVQTATTNHLFDVDYSSSSLSSSDLPPIVLHANLRCQVADVQHELLNFRPHIVHFYAHMNVEEVVLMGEGTTLEDEQQQSDALHTELLTQIMTAHNEDIRCVLLTGCWSQAMGKKLEAEANVPYVLFTTTKVHYVACQVYCATWYAAVFAGHSVGQAAGQAQNQLEADPRTRHLGAGLIQQAGDEELVLLPALHPAGPARSRMADTFQIPRRDIEYIKRPRVWRELRKALLELGRRRFVVLTGLGGVGKSQLALEYITDPPPGNDRYRFIAWFAAENPSQLVGAYLDLAEQFMGPAGVELKGKSEDVVVSAVKTWLERQQFWLLVYDNATSWDAIVKYLPGTTQSRTQHIIVTSRHQDWPIKCNKVEVGEMELSECVELVKTNTRIGKHDRSQNVDIYILADRLGRLPLALSQAAAYIARQRVSVRTYIDAYERLLVQKSTASLPTGDPHEIVAITWDVTMSVLHTETEKQKLPPLGRIVLTVCSYLAPDAIPRSLLQRWLDLAYPALPAGVDVCSTVLDLLRAYSLIRFVDAQNQYISIHRVLRTVVRHQHQGEPAQLPQRGSLSAFSGYSLPWWCNVVHRMLRTVVEWRQQQRQALREPQQADVAIFPRYSVSWWCSVVVAVNAEFHRAFDQTLLAEKHQRQLLPHLEGLGSFYRQKVSASDDSHAHIVCAELLDNTSTVLLHGLRDYSRTKRTAEEALAIKSKLLDSDHPLLGLTLEHIGQACGGLGDYVQEKAMLERALAINEVAFGPDHVRVAATQSNLSTVRGSSGLGAVQQKELLERALAITERAHGSHHLHVGVILTNLGNSCGRMGDHVKQKKLLERALLIREAAYGRDHISVAAILTNLSNAYGTLGDYDKQKELLERALVITEATLGSSHVDLAVIVMNLGNVHGALGNYGQQRELQERTLAIKEAHFPANHIELAAALSNLSSVCGKVGDHTEQQRLLQRALAIQEAHYPANHIDLAVTLGELGSACGKLGDYAQQQRLLQRALVIAETHYCADHIELADTMNNLSHACGSLGEYAEQQRLLQRALAIQEAHYSANHIHLASVLNNLGGACGKLGDYAQQKRLFQRALTIQEAHYSANHIELATALTNLGSACGSLGEYAQQLQLLQRALVIQEAHYPANHIDLAVPLGVLGWACGKLGQYAQQQRLLQRALAIKEAHYHANHIDLAPTLNNLSTACRKLGDYGQQLRLLQRALAIQEAHYPANHIELAVTLTNLGGAYGSVGDHARQLQLLQRALAIKEAHYPANHIDLAPTLGNLSNAHSDLGDSAQQQRLLQRALAIQEAHYPANHIELAVTLGNLGNACGKLGDYAQQQRLLLRALAIKEAHYPADHISLALTLSNLGSACGRLGHHAQQQRLLQRAVAIQEARYPPDHIDLAPTLINLGAAYGCAGDYAQQQRLMQRALSIQKVYYPANHKEVLATMSDLRRVSSILDCHNQQRGLPQTSVASPPEHPTSPPRVVSHKLTLLCWFHFTVESDVQYLVAAVSSWKDQKYSSKGAVVPLWLSISFADDVNEAMRQNVGRTIASLASQHLVLVSCKTHKTQFEHLALLTNRYVAKHPGADLTRHWLAFLNGSDTMGPHRMECFMKWIPRLSCEPPPNHDLASYHVSQVITMPHRQSADGGSAQLYWQHAVTVQVFDWFLKGTSSVLLNNILADVFFCHSLHPSRCAQVRDKHPAVSTPTIAFSSAEEARGAAYRCCTSPWPRAQPQQPALTDRDSVRRSLYHYLADAGQSCSENGFIRCQRLLTEQQDRGTPSNLVFFRQCWQEESATILAVLRLPLIYHQFGRKRVDGVWKQTAQPHLNGCVGQERKDHGQPSHECLPPLGSAAERRKHETERAIDSTAPLVDAEGREEDKENDEWVPANRSSLHSSGIRYRSSGARPS